MFRTYGVTTVCVDPDIRPGTVLPETYLKPTVLYFKHKGLHVTVKLKILLLNPNVYFLLFLLFTRLL